MAYNSYSRNLLLVTHCTCNKIADCDCLWKAPLGKVNKVCMYVIMYVCMYGSQRAYLSRNRCTITWVSNCKCPIWNFVIGYLCDSHVNYVHFNGFFCDVLYSFQNLWNARHTFLHKGSCYKTFLIPKFVINTINY